VKDIKQLLEERFMDCVGGPGGRGGGGGGGGGAQRRLQCGIIYCLSRHECEKVAEQLNQELAGMCGRHTLVK
jgi:hypothetical protein